ncbi:type I secretion system permease/ATPase [Quisquiliibacterium transsilvanicum]|uniref:ATP-binding cassette subfamily C exporter for protease/lipase n=1 Tax=Quisquiliibacterium transsilvanicum TaxID=1549638 RepID=A0A7W8HHC1_9BURK|nr:type I secretion system permease/ATPase [Quisquiliibacterium transsilvanicum]MBB5272041.1 ATP-binding cassette subfamily C exporter for protease/lipase [Quisquiliibacterium transsilvanicum]
MKAAGEVSELRAAALDMRPMWRMGLLLSGAIGLLGFASTVYMFQVYGRVVDSRSVTTLLMLTLATTAAFAVMELLDKLRQRLFWAGSLRFDLRMTPRVYQASMGVLASGRPHSTSRVMSDMRSVREFFVNPALTALFELPMSLLALVLIFMISPVLGWAALFGGALQTLVAWMNQRISRAPLQEAQRGAQEAHRYADVTLRNAQVMHSMGMLESVLRRWQERQSRFLVSQARASEAAGALTAASKTLQQLMGSVLLGLSAWLLLGNNLAGGPAMLIISSVLGGRMLVPLTQLVSQWSAIVTFAGAFTRLEGLLREIPARDRSMPLPPPKGELRVEQLHVAPLGLQQLVLRGLQFHLTPGQVLAVVGPSASGKTSLAKALLGAWPAQAGKVRLDGVDVFSWDKDELGPYLGYLPQEVELIDGTLAENIARFGQPDALKLQEAAALVGLQEFIASLSQGYDAPVGRDGALLSGGQRQRVALARALYGRPALVVLDEPNSSLDEIGEAALLRAIGVLKSTGTTFVINTHRTGVLSVSDRLLVLREGAQLAFGPTVEVLQKLRDPSGAGGQAAAPATAPRMLQGGTA